MIDVIDPDGLWHTPTFSPGHLHSRHWWAGDELRCQVDRAVGVGLSYDVVIAEDLTAGLSAEDHRFSINRILPNIAGIVAPRDIHLDAGSDHADPAPSPVAAVETIERPLPDCAPDAGQIGRNMAEHAVRDPVQHHRRGADLAGV